MEAGFVLVQESRKEIIVLCAKVDTVETEVDGFSNCFKGRICKTCLGWSKTGE